MSDLRDNLIAWTDLETTGSDETLDSIIEIGIVLTDPDLTTISEFSSTVRPADVGVGRMMRNKVVREMHGANGLLDEILRGEHLSPNLVALQVLTWLTAHGAREGHVIVGGSGVGHFDMRFISRYMPQVAAYCRYWVFDIGTVRRMHELFTGTNPPYDIRGNGQAAGKTHRALDDARVHLAEAKAFRELWRTRHIDWSGTA